MTPPSSPDPCPLPHQPWEKGFLPLLSKEADLGQQLGLHRHPAYPTQAASVQLLTSRAGTLRGQAAEEGSVSGQMRSCFVYRAPVRSDESRAG